MLLREPLLGLGCPNDNHAPLAAFSPLMWRYSSLVSTHEAEALVQRSTSAYDPERTSDVMWSPLLRRSRERSIGRQRDPGVA
jgi:hypothetical protein